MRFLTSLIFFLSLGTYAIGQTISQADSVVILCRIDNRNSGWNNTWRTEWKNDWKKKDYRLPTKWYSETTANNGLTIQNSLPKGGGYTDSNGKNFGYGIFFTRIVNETSSPLELTMSFPDAILPLPESYLKLFLPADTMTLDKVLLYDYGATGLKSFLDAGINSPTMLKRTINPGEEVLFYIGALFNHENDVARAELVLNEQQLFYRLVTTAPGLNSALIPCGRISFKE